MIPFTPRQHDVVALLARGLTNTEIGEQLGMSHKTVAVHVGGAMLRSGARNRVELATMYVLGDVPRPGLRRVA